MTRSGANGNHAYDTQVVQDEDEPGGGRAKRRRARMHKVEVVQGGEARLHGDRAGIVTAGVLTIVISAWGALIAFVEPIFGFARDRNAVLALERRAYSPGRCAWCRRRGDGPCRFVGVRPGRSGSKSDHSDVGRTDHHPQRSVVHRRANCMASDHHQWCVLRSGSSAQRLGVSGWICPWYWSHIGRMWRIHHGMGFPSSNQRFGERRRGIGTNGGLSRTIRAQDSVGTSAGVDGLSPSNPSSRRPYGRAALKAQKGLIASDPRVYVRLDRGCSIQCSRDTADRTECPFPLGLDRPLLIRATDPRFVVGWMVCWLAPPARSISAPFAALWTLTAPIYILGGVPFWRRGGVQGGRTDVSLSIRGRHYHRPGTDTAHYERAPSFECGDTVGIDHP